MNDITKARYFLQAKKSDLQHLESFALMLATAESRYREIKMQQQRRTSEMDQTHLGDKEIEAAVDYAVLRYLKKHNQLPSDVVKAVSLTTPPDEKMTLAQKWSNA